MERLLDKLIELLARLIHTMWANWMKYFLSKCIVNEQGRVEIPPDYLINLHRQINLSYDELTPLEQDLDRTEAMVIVEHIKLLMEEEDDK